MGWGKILEFFVLYMGCLIQIVSFLGVGVVLFVLQFLGLVLSQFIVESNKYLFIEGQNKGYLVQFFVGCLNFFNDAFLVISDGGFLNVKYQFSGGGRNFYYFEYICVLYLKEIQKGQY